MRDKNKTDVHTSTRSSTDEHAHAHEHMKSPSVAVEVSSESLHHDGDIRLLALALLHQLVTREDRLSRVVSSHMHENLGAGPRRRPTGGLVSLVLGQGQGCACAFK